MKWKKIVEAKEYEAEAREVCDFCGVEIRQRAFERDEVTIEAKIGNIYPEGDFSKTELFDCCVKCWVNKVIPALQAIGGRVYSYESDEGRVKTMPFE